jgi:hypothetical protein
MSTGTGSEASRRVVHGERAKSVQSEGSLFVILRYDAFQDTSVPIENRVTATGLVADAATAEREVARLKSLNASKGCYYFWQPVRLRSNGLEQ